MKTVKKKRSEWQNLLRSLRNNAAYRRVLNIREIHRKRVLREYIEWDYKVNKKEYDREFERDWIRQQRESENYVPASTFMETIGAVPRRKADRW